MYRARHPLDEEETLNNIYNLTHPHEFLPAMSLTPVHHERDENIREYLYDRQHPTRWTIMYKSFLAKKRRIQR